MRRLFLTLSLAMFAAVAANKNGNPIPQCDPCPWVRVAHGPTVPPDPWDGHTMVAHGPTIPPDPWEGLRVKHGPSLPPDPWDGVRAV